jgi:hypothetical protein
VSTDSPDLLRNRYGATRRTRRIGTRGWIGITAVATLLASVFIAWAAIGQQRGPTFQNVSFQVVSEAGATADFDLTKEPGTVVTCAVRALNEQFAVVGWTEVTIGAVPEQRRSGTGTSSHRVGLRTTNLATTAGVDSCWVEQ